jgi:hypothetical protein
MLALVKFVTIPFDESIANSLLLTFAETSLGRIVAHNTGILEGHFTDRVTPTRAAITAAEAVVTDINVKLALQKARTEAKENFVAALPANVAKVYGAVLAVFGPNAPEMTEFFPLGRTVFSQCANEQLNNHLEQLAAAVTAHAAALPAATATLASGLVTGWAAVYSAAGAAKDAKGVSALARDAAIQALRVELFKNIMTCGLYFPDDTDKAELLFPQYLLEGRSAATTPGPATLALQSFNAQSHVATFTLSAEGATSFRMYRRLAGEADLTQVSADIAATDGAATFSIVLEGTATYEFAAEGVNGTRVGERSEIVTVAQG